MLFTRFKCSFRLLLIVLSTLMMVSCGSGDGETSVSDTPQTGALLDGPVLGLTYASETQSGTTNAAGEFKYFPNETIVFSIGGIKLGQVTLLKPSASGEQALITPVELTASTDASDPKVVRLLQLLQSLDSDGDHSNGITISAATRDAAASLVIDFSDPDFDTNNPSFNLQALVDDIADPGDPTPTIVSPAEALENFGTTIAENGLDISLTPTFQLVWADEFNASTLNSEDWNFETGYGPGDSGWGNDEWQLYTENSENLSIVFGEESDPANGYLRISAQCPAPGVDNAGCQKRNDSITSAKINTKDKREFQFGKIEARIKVPTGKGAWPAFWSLGAGYPETPWPAAGEIDFMEVFSVDNSSSKDGLFTIHWEEPDGSGTRQFTTTARTFDATDFHVFSAEWTEQRIIGRLDGVAFASYDLDSATQSELLEPFYLILNVAMGGNPVPGLVPDATTVWPQEMLVDWVRVYQTVGDFNAPVLSLEFEGNSPQFVCLEDGSGCGGATGFAGADASIQPNPDTNGNTSANAVRFLKFDPGNGQAFGGTLVRLTDGALDFAASNNIFTVKVYSTRSVPVRLELGDDNPDNGSPGVDVVHTGTGWEELTFDVSSVVSQVTKFNQIVFIFDNGTVGDAGGDPDNWTFYFDDIILQKAPEDVVIDTGGGDFGDGSSDGTGFGVFSETNTATAVSNTNIVSAGNTVGIDGASIAVTPFEGSTVLALTFSDNAEGNGFGGAVFQFDSVDVTAFNALKFTIDTASFDNFANLTVQLEPPAGGTAGGNVSLADYEPIAALGNWKTYEIPLADFPAVNPASISALGFFNARDGSDVLLAGTLYLDDIHFTGTGGGGGGPGGGSLPFSDGFESGDLAGWTAAANGGSITADNTQAGGGVYSARLVAATSQAPALSIVGLSAGSVSPNDTIDVSWDMCGSFAGGGEVMFPALISERGDGSGGERVFDTIASVPGEWTRFTRSFAANADAANLVGGVSVQFDVVCGGDAGCAADVFIDNVNITNGGGDPGGAASGLSCSAGGGGGDPVPVGDGIELLTNGDFETSPTDKAPWTNAGTVTTNNFYTVDANDGGNVFDTNLSQTVTLTNGLDYVLSFRARASVERDIVVGIGDGGAPFVAALVTPAPTLTTDWQSFSFPLTAINDGGAASRVLFDLGTVASTVDIDDVSLVLASAPGVNLLTNADFETSPTDKAPWTNAGTVTTNNFYTVDANDGGNVFDTNLSQTVALTNGVEYVLSYRARASVERDIVVGIGDDGAPFVAALVTPGPTLTTEWQTFTHALTAVNDGGAASRVLFDLGTVASTVDIDDVSLQVIDTGGGGTGGEIAVNGGLEDGLTGWEATPNGGTSELSSADAQSGLNSARLRADVAANGGAASFPDIKLANVGVGVVTADQALTVSFWTKTVEQTGAVPFFAQLFTEQAGGGASKTDFLIEPPTFLTIGDWTQHSFNVTLGADASAGVSLLFKADCGATPDCVLEVFIDDVSITPTAP